MVKKQEAKPKIEDQQAPKQEGGPGSDEGSATATPAAPVEEKLLTRRQRRRLRFGYPSGA